jgi:hypothetical protein
VPKTTLAEITDAIRNADFDRLEVLCEQEPDEPGIFVLGLVFLNKARDTGLYFSGIRDHEGYHVSYSTAADVLDALKAMADEHRVDLSMICSGGYALLPGNDQAFLTQLEKQGLYWAKDQAQVSPLDTDVIPEGSFCLDCPYRSFRDDKPKQMNGYCEYLGHGDWMTKLGFSDLWDGVKECEVKRDSELSKIKA